MSWRKGKDAENCVLLKVKNEFKYFNNDKSLEASFYNQLTTIKKILIIHTKK